MIEIDVKLLMVFIQKRIHIWDSNNQRMLQLDNHGTEGRLVHLAKSRSL